MRDSQRTKEESRLVNELACLMEIAGWLNGMGNSAPYQKIKELLDKHEKTRQTIKPE